MVWGGVQPKCRQHASDVSASIACACHLSETRLSHADDECRCGNRCARPTIAVAWILRRGRAMRHFTSLSIVFTLFLFSGACASDTSSSTTAPTPAPPTTTDTFSGTVGQLATTGNPFAVSTNGPVTIELTSVEPLSTMALGVGITTWDGTACGTVAISKNDDARSGTTALTGTATAGNYCVTVYDSGNIPEGWTVSFGVQVVHP